jgi:histidinol-phosphate phosphatase family protein
MASKAVFLDRDGTLIIDRGYLSSPQGLRFFPKVKTALKQLKEAHFLCIIISNQSGIGRGIIKKEAVEAIHKTLKERLAKVNISLDDIYYCPHHPSRGCRCRKPNTGLIKRAVKKFDIDLRKSFVIGDKPEDIELARKSGCRSVLVNSSRVSFSTVKIRPNFIARTFLEGVNWIIENS